MKDFPAPGASFQASTESIQMLNNLQGERTSFHEGCLYFTSRQNGSQLGAHLLIDANETEVDKKIPNF